MSSPSGRSYRFALSPLSLPLCFSFARIPPSSTCKTFSIHIAHIALCNHEVYIKKYPRSKALLILSVPRFVSVFPRVPEFKMSTRSQSPLSLSESFKNNTNSNFEAEFQFGWRAMPPPRARAELNRAINFFVGAR